MVAVALLTCDRFEYTRATVESLFAHNDVSGWELFYADDASTDRRIRPYVESRGFKPVVLHEERHGCSPTTEALFLAIGNEVPPETIVLYLQNDFESVRAIPLDLCKEHLNRPDVGFIQVFYWRPRLRYTKLLEWIWPDGQPWDFRDGSRGNWVQTKGNAGQGFQPSMARADTYKAAAHDLKKERDFLQNTKTLNKRVVRLTNAPLHHIGQRRTPGGKYGKVKKTNYQNPRAARQYTIMKSEE
jgi:hypothetical protein